MPRDTEQLLIQASTKWTLTSTPCPQCDLETYVYLPTQNTPYSYLRCPTCQINIFSSDTIRPRNKLDEKTLDLLHQNYDPRI